MFARVIALAAALIVMATAAEARRVALVLSSAITERLAKADPGNAGWQHNLAASYR